MVKKGEVKWQDDEGFEVEAILDYVKEEVESDGEQVRRESGKQMAVIMISSCMPNIAHCLQCS